MWISTKSRKQTKLYFRFSWSTHTSPNRPLYLPMYNIIIINDAEKERELEEKETSVVEFPLLFII